MNPSSEYCAQKDLLGDSKKTLEPVVAAGDMKQRLTSAGVSILFYSAR